MRKVGAPQPSIPCCSAESGTSHISWTAFATRRCAFDSGLQVVRGVVTGLAAQQQKARVLAGAVVVQPARPLAGGGQRVASLAVVGCMDPAAEMSLLKVAARQQLRCHLRMHRGALMAGRGQRQLTIRQAELVRRAGLQQGQRLQRLGGRTTEHHLMRIAGTRQDAVVASALRQFDHHQRAAMPRLHRTTSGHGCQQLRCRSRERLVLGHGRPGGLAPSCSGPGPRGEAVSGTPPPRAGQRMGQRAGLAGGAAGGASGWGSGPQPAVHACACHPSTPRYE